jgi:hypothetical protein
MPATNDKRREVPMTDLVHVWLDAVDNDDTTLTSFDDWMIHYHPEAIDAEFETLFG